MKLDILIKNSKGEYFSYYEEVSNKYSFEGKFSLGILKDKIELQTQHLDIDLFSLFYSINDYLEFEFSSIRLGENATLFSYEKDNDSLLLRIDNKIFKINSSLFLNLILKNSYDFFKINNEISEFEMYLDLINILEKRLNKTN